MFNLFNSKSTKQRKDTLSAKTNSIPLQKKHPSLSEAVSYPRPIGIQLFILFVPRFLVLLVGMTYWQLMILVFREADRKEP